MFLTKRKLLLSGLLPILHMESIYSHWLQPKGLPGLLLNVTGLIFHAIVADALGHRGDPRSYCALVLGQLWKAQTWLFMLEVHSHEVLLRFTNLVRHFH